MPLLQGGAAGSLGPADLESMGFEVVAIDLLEMAISPGLELIADAGGLAAFTAWPGTMVALVRTNPPAADGEGGPTGWRARRAPILLRQRDDELTLRSPIDGSTHHLTFSGLARAAVELGATPTGELMPPGTLAWWDSDREQPPTADWVVSAVPADSARAGRYWMGTGWAEIAAQQDPAAPGRLVEGCPCRTCVIARIGYISHLWQQREITAAHLLGWHNLHRARLLVEG